MPLARTRSTRPLARIGRPLAAGLALALLPLVVSAQVRQPEDTVSAGEGAGPISDISGGPVHDGSAAMHDGAQPLGDSSGPVHSGPVRDATTRSMRSGPVSEISSGPMTERRPPITSGAVEEASAGAVTHDIDSPLGERISQPLRELEPLRQQMRAQRERAEHAALLAASAPSAVDVPAPAHIEPGVAPSEPIAAGEQPAPDTNQPEHATAPVTADGGAAPADAQTEPQAAADGHSVAVDAGAAPASEPNAANAAANDQPIAADGDTAPAAEQNEPEAAAESHPAAATDTGAAPADDDAAAGAADDAPAAAQ